MRFLLALVLASGCMSTTHYVVTGKDCAPPELVLGDLFAGSLVTGVGVVGDVPTAVTVGTFMLVGATINWVAQVANCN